MGNIAKKMAQDSKNILRREDYRRVKRWIVANLRNFVRICIWKGIRTAEIRFPE